MISLSYGIRKPCLALFKLPHSTFVVDSVLTGTGTGILTKVVGRKKGRKKNRTTEWKGGPGAKVSEAKLAYYIYPRDCPGFGLSHCIHSNPP